MKIWKIASVAALVATALTPSVAQAHFVWATIEKGQVRFALLENPSQKPDARFGKYVEGLKSPLALGSVTDGARFCALPTNKKPAFADATVGVKSREGVDYLLRYHARAAASPEDASRASGAAFELRATRTGGELAVSVWQDGWPVPATEVTLHLPGTAEEQKTATTDLKGEVRFAFPEPTQTGFVGIRAKIVEENPGTFEGKNYAEVHHWTTLTFPVGSFVQTLRAALGVHHDDAGRAAFNTTLFAGKLTRSQLEVHFQQRALIHHETDRVLTAAMPTLGALYGPAQKDVLVSLREDLTSLGSSWPTEAQARPSTAAFLQEIRESEKSGPFFALGVQHVYFGGITNGGRLIGQKINTVLNFSSNYYSKTDGYRQYLGEVNKISSPTDQSEMLRGGQAAYRYILTSSNEDVFKISEKS